MPPDQSPPRDGPEGAPPQGDFGAPPQGGGAGAPPQGDFGAPPQGGGFGAPPQGGGFGGPPQGGGFGAPPQGGGFGAPPQDGGAGAPPQDGGFGAPPQGGGFGAPPQGGGFGGPPQGGGAGSIEVGDLLSTAGRVAGENIVSFLVVCGICMTPVFLLSTIHQELSYESLNEMVMNPYSPKLPGNFFGIWAWGMLIGVLHFAFAYVAQAAIVHGTVESMAGRRVTATQTLTKSLTRIGPVLIAGFFVTLATLIAAFFCLLPVIIPPIVFFATIPAIVVEGLGPLEGMSRSLELTRDHWLTIFLVGLILLAVYLTLICVLGVLGGAGAMASGGAMTPSLPVRIFNYLFAFGVNIASTLVWAVVAAVFYARVRGIRDGVDAKALADVFA